MSLKYRFGLLLGLVLMALYPRFLYAESTIVLSSKTNFAFGLTAKDVNNNALLESKIPGTTHKLILRREQGDARFESVYMTFASSSGTVIGTTKLVVDKDSSSRSVQEIEFFVDKFPMINELKKSIRRSDSEPLSMYLYSQFLKSSGTAAESITYEVMIALLEFKSLYNLACINPHARLFDTDQATIDLLLITNVLRKVDATSYEFDRDYLTAWNRTGVRIEKSKKRLREMSFCEWKRYDLVNEETTRNRFLEAYEVIGVFFSKWKNLPDEQKQMVLQVTGYVDKARIENDFVFLKGWVNRN